MTKLTIDRNDIIVVLMRASSIPHGSTVTKRTGEKPYTLKHNLKVYPLERLKDNEPMVISGYFICYEGEFTQIQSDTLLHWHVDASSFQVLLSEAIYGEG